MVDTIDTSGTSRLTDTYIACSIVLLQRGKLFAQRSHCGVRGRQWSRMARQSLRSRDVQMERISVDINHVERGEHESCNDLIRLPIYSGTCPLVRVSDGDIIGPRPRITFVAYFARGRFRNSTPLL